MIKERFYGAIDPKTLVLDDGETAARLKVARGYTDSAIQKCERLLRSVADVRYCAARLGVAYPENGEIDFGFRRIESRDLFRNLAGAGEVFIMAVTLGIKVDMTLKRLSATSPAENYITDALSSSLAESACDEAEKRIVGGNICRPRFSPGYGDLELGFQRDVLDILDARKTLGITLAESLLMTPQKTITAVIGIKSNG